MGSIRKKQRNALAPEETVEPNPPEHLCPQPKPNQTHTSAGSCRVRNTSSKIRNQTQTRTEDTHWFTNMQTHTGQNHAKDESTHSCSCTLLSLPPRELRFRQHLSFGGTFVTLPLHSLPLAPHLALFLVLRVLPWGPSEPQSGGVSPGDGVGASRLGSCLQVLVPPRSCQVAAWGACSGLIWERKAGGGRDRGLGNSVFSTHLFCNSRERPSPLWASVSLSVSQISLQ